MASTPDVFTPVVATANDLRSGAVVFLAAAATWTGDIAQAVVADDPHAAAALLDAAQRDHLACRVVEPVLIEIRRVAGRIEPASLRERIRADGPTIDPLVDVPSVR
jgi:hypothetical protein